MELITERTVDELGRIVIPAEVRTKLGIAERSKLGIYADGCRIVLAKVTPTCRICGSPDGYNTELHICEACREKIKQS